MDRRGFLRLASAAAVTPALGGLLARAGVAGPARQRGPPRVVAAVGLWEQRHKRPAQVSGGMQQRTAVARAFAVSPRILLLDEPFGALDALTRARLQAQLTDLWQDETAPKRC